MNKLNLESIRNRRAGAYVYSLGLSEAFLGMRRDTVMVTLMNEALNAPNQARRIAARLLLDLTRRDAVKVGQKVAKAKATPEVVRELHSLIAEHGLSQEVLD